MFQEEKNRIIPVSIDKEMSESYLNYAMSVIVSRALPDVRDGLKPVHRRILYSMQEMGLAYTRSYKKCGRIVGDVLGKYHPHGDQSIYEALVRMAQEFSLRYPLVLGQGNFGSIDGDPPAAMRYTEAKLQSISEEILNDIKKKTVDFKPNYDDSLLEPSVLPAALPFLLLNGASGIAVGMATQIPPHNLKEVVQGLLYYMDHPEATLGDLMQFIKGPDFPTAGLICGKRGIYEAYRTGRGQIIMRGLYHLEEMDNGRERIVFTEIPYQVNKANLMIRISDLIKNKQIEGISDIRDESNRKGIRVVIELKRNIQSSVILEQLFSSSDLQKSFNVNSLALVDGKPKQLALHDFLDEFLKFRKEVIKRRTQFDLEKAQAREHILFGLRVALDNIDEIVNLIKKASSPSSAKIQLIDKFNLTEIQSQAILDMRLQRLTGLEIQKIYDELKELSIFISSCQEILSSETKLLYVIKEELHNILDRFSDERRTEIQEREVSKMSTDESVQRAEMVVLLSSAGYIKRVPLSEYRSQGRGGKGITSTLREDDSILKIVSASTHDYLFYVTNHGRAFVQKVYDLEVSSRTSKGKHVEGFLKLSEGEVICSLVTFADYSANEFILIATQRAQGIRIATEAFRNARLNGVNAITITEGDRVVNATWTNGKSQLIGFTESGYGIRFTEDQIRETARGAKGVGVMDLSRKDTLGNYIKEDNLLALLSLSEEEKEVIVISEKGYAKRMLKEEISQIKRNGKGVRCYKGDTKTGNLVGALSLRKDTSVMCVTSLGKTLKTEAEEVALQSRGAKGVLLLKLDDGDTIVSCATASQDEE